MVFLRKENEMKIITEKHEYDCQKENGLIRLKSNRFKDENGILGFFVEDIEIDNRTVFVTTKECCLIDDNGNAKLLPKYTGILINVKDIKEN